MTYLVDPCGTGAPPEDATVVLVGCGGTGAFLAEALCRLLVGRRGALHLVDLDRVEEHNVARQAFLCGIRCQGAARLRRGSGPMRPRGAGRRRRAGG
jgi:hypothetical protein